MPFSDVVAFHLGEEKLCLGEGLVRRGEPEGGSSVIFNWQCWECLGELCPSLR